MGASLTTTVGKFDKAAASAQLGELLLNRYRVLLTRARDGMVIWIPEGVVADPTLDPRILDETTEYLEAAGLPQL